MRVAMDTVMISAVCELNMVNMTLMLNWLKLVATCDSLKFMLVLKFVSTKAFYRIQRCNRTVLQYNTTQ